MTARQRPEALAQFAETARNAKRRDQPGLVADRGTAPIPTDPKEKDEAATKVLQEGATGEDHGAAEAADWLPDRILESRRSNGADDPTEEPDVTAAGEKSYDATRDPRTGRPPLPPEAERLKQERELQQLRNAQLSEGEEAEEDEIEEDEIDVELENEDTAVVNTMIDQEPGKMVSPPDDEEDDETENL